MFTVLAEGSWCLRFHPNFSTPHGCLQTWVKYYVIQSDVLRTFDRTKETTYFRNIIITLFLLKPRSAWYIQLIYFNSSILLTLLPRYLNSLTSSSNFQLELIYLNFSQSFHQTVEVTSTLTRSVDNVVITTKDLQDRNNNCLMERRWKIKAN